MKQNAPLAIFAFNRPEYLQRTLQALAQNTLASETDVTIFCDGPRNEQDMEKIEEVHAVAQSATGFHTLNIVKRDINMGCANSVITGINTILEEDKHIIVIEDDVVCSPYTLSFLNKGLHIYKNNQSIFDISAWSLPPSLLPIPDNYAWDVYAIPRFNCSGGWASWRDRFQEIDWEVSDYETFKTDAGKRHAFNAGGMDLSPMLDDQMAGKLDSWAIRADYARFKRSQLGINPVRSYATNIGMSSGTHCKVATTLYDNDVSLAVEKPRFLPDIFRDVRIEKAYWRFYSRTNSKIRTAVTLRKHLQQIRFSQI
ncbi:MAG: glycosyltransferase [Desulfovibrio sp.]|uniref:glycosyltransferase n=1 Tax=Desulfovibrio sp. TaxID=885 RepID=UPI0025C4390F|nr:glycosyltransferase [Desulfovibrio sp.]MBS6830307.1 glycosyltransferase [Desulfovibrio sp.]